MSLELVYAITAVPAEIHASAAGATSVVDLHVSIAPPPGTSVSSVRELSISFGDGSEGGSLTDLTLPAPVPAPDPSLWSYDDTVDPPVLTPQAPIDAPLLYSLQNVVVDETPGQVAITATEVPASGGSPASGNVTTLTKLDASLVSNFSAVPPSISAVDETVTLEWSVSSAAYGYLYQVRSDADWSSAQLEVDSSGQGSVVSPGLSRSTQFWLDVIDASSGSDETIATFKLSVDLDIPDVTKADSTIQGMVATLRWTTIGATSCEVRFDGHVKVSSAPPDTWADGFPAFLGVASGSGPNVSLVAVSASGATSDARVVGTLSPDAPTRLTGSAGSGAVAISSRSDRAYVAGTDSIAVVDLVARQMLAPLVPTGDGAPGLVGIMDLAYVSGRFAPPDWVIAVVAPAIVPIRYVVMIQPSDPSKWFTSVPVYGDADNQQNANLLGPVGGSLSAGYALSWNSYGPDDPSDGDLYLWMYNTDSDTPRESNVYLSQTYWSVDNSDGTVLDSALASMAVASAASMALLGGNDGTVILGQEGGATPWYSQVGSGRVVTGAAGNFGICGAADGTVTTFDLSPGVRRVGPAASLWQTVAAVGVTPDGAHGFAVLADGTLHVVDTATGTVDPNSVSLGFAPADIAVAPNWPQGPVVITGTGGEILLF